MRHYETTYILRPSLGETVCTEIIDRTNGIVAEFGGTLIVLERIGLRTLAYAIKKESQGNYVYMNFAAPAEAIAEIERVFRIDDRVLRYLTVKLGDNIDAEGIERERERIAAVAAARVERDAAEAENEGREQRDRRQGTPAGGDSGKVAAQDDTAGGSDETDDEKE